MMRRMSIEVLSRTAEFQSLSVKQRFWLQTYIASGCPVLATQAAYGNEGENARTFSYQLLRSPKIKTALNRYLNRSKREIALDELLAASKPGSGTRKTLLTLHAQVFRSPKKKGASR